MKDNGTIKDIQFKIMALIDEVGGKLHMVSDFGDGILIDVSKFKSFEDTHADLEITTIYSSLNAETDYGSINLVDELHDGEYWLMIADSVYSMIERNNKLATLNIFQTTP